MTSYLRNFSAENCSGCGACLQVCPAHCISFQESVNEGFLYPQIDEDRCLNCDKCKHVCQYEQSIPKQRIKSCWAARNCNKGASEESSSGGLFYAFAKAVIDQGGVVAGACFDESFSCHHEIASSMEQLIPMLGSKYVQSRCDNVYGDIECYLKKGIEVLFSGTPCQVAGLKKYLRKSYSGLICIDLVCHGVPSQADFQQCIRSLERKGTLKSLKFRDKKRSGWQHAMSYSLICGDKQKTKTVLPYQVPYYYNFLKGRNLRESCYHCLYTGTERVGDITLADFWKAEKYFSDSQIGTGLSAVLINTEVGEQLWERCRQKLWLSQVDLKQVASGNQPFQKPCNPYPLRSEMLKTILEKGYNGESYIRGKELAIARVKAAIPEKCKRMIRRYF